MHPKQYALISGILFLVVGLASLVPAWSTFPADLPRLTLETSYGAFLGIFALNMVSKIALIATGIWGIMAANAPTTNLPKSVNYARFLFAATGIMAILGLIPTTNTLFGYWPLFGAAGGAAGIVCLVSAYFGFALTSKASKLADKVPEYHENRKAS